MKIKCAGRCRIKVEGIIPLDEFKDKAGEYKVESGDVVELMLETSDNGYGETYQEKRFGHKFGIILKMLMIKLKMHLVSLPIVQLAASLSI